MLFVFVKSHMTYFLNKAVWLERHNRIIFISSIYPVIYNKTVDNKYNRFVLCFFNTQIHDI